MVAKVESWNQQRSVIAGEIREYVAAAQKLLGELGHTADAGALAVAAGAKAFKTGRRAGFTMSAEAKRKISIAAKARWAARRGQTAEANAEAKPAKKKRNVSPAVRARLARLAKARWAKAKKAGRNKL